MPLVCSSFGMPTESCNNHARDVTARSGPLPAVFVGLLPDASFILQRAEIPKIPLKQVGPPLLRAARALVALVIPLAHRMGQHIVRHSLPEHVPAHTGRPEVNTPEDSSIGDFRHRCRKTRERPRPRPNI